MTEPVGRDQNCRGLSVGTAATAVTAATLHSKHPTTAVFILAGVALEKVVSGSVSYLFDLQVREGSRRRRARGFKR